MIASIDSKNTVKKVNSIYSKQKYLKTSFILFCPGQDVKRYPGGVRLDNRKVLLALGPRTKHFERLFF